MLFCGTQDGFCCRCDMTGSALEHTKPDLALPARDNPRRIFVHPLEGYMPIPVSLGRFSKIFRVPAAYVAVALSMALPSLASAQSTDEVAAQAQTTYYACYVPGTGTVYRIKLPGLP